MPVIEQKTTNKNKVDFDLNRLDKSKTTIFSKYPKKRGYKNIKDYKRSVIAEQDSARSKLNRILTVIDDAQWLYEKFGEGAYQDIPGLCKVASRAEIAEKNYSLTPGAYVGVAAVEDDGVDFAQRMAEIHQELLTLQAESNELMQTISRNMKEMGR